MIKIRGKATEHSMKNRVPFFKWLRRNRCRHELNLLAFVLLALLCTPKPVQAIYIAIYNGTQAQVSVASSLSPATFSSPDGLALDLAGNLYIADTGNNRILKAPAGSATAALFAVSIGGTPAAFNNPRKLAVDSAGNLYIADTGNNRVVKSDPLGNGTVLSIGSSLSPANPQRPARCRRRYARRRLYLRYGQQPDRRVTFCWSPYGAGYDRYSPHYLKLAPGTGRRHVQQSVHRRQEQQPGD